MIISPHHGSRVPMRNNISSRICSVKSVEVLADGRAHINSGKKK